jgi:uncharacterized oxidoreductase
LRHQLKGSGVKVIEVIPPYVATELGGGHPPAGAMQPMPLEAFIADTMKELDSDADEIAIGGSKNLLAAGNPENIKTIFARMNP